VTGDGPDYPRTGKVSAYPAFFSSESATLLLEKGGDIDAACGQLRLKQETAEGIISST
jgi:hypothetical protein